MKEHNLLPKTVFLLIVLFIFSSLSLAYVPPVYIANPDTGECKYYFAGDSTHFNDIPDGKWFVVGITDLNATDCSDRCYFNTNKFWSEVIQVTRSGLNISSVPLEYRMFTDLGCFCQGNGTLGCENWCTVNGGGLNQTNWSTAVSCNCPSGKWIPGKGCQAASASNNSSTGQKDMVMAVIIYLVLIVAGIIIGMLIAAMRLGKHHASKEEKSHEHRVHEAKHHAKKKR
jgi:hypothetical protein